MALVDNKIKGETEIREFPDIYNRMISELSGIIAEKDREIAQLKADIRRLRSDLSEGMSDIRARYESRFDQEWESRVQTMFDQKMLEFEERFVKKNNN